MESEAVDLSSCADSAEALRHATVIFIAVNGQYAGLFAIANPSRKPLQLPFVPYSMMAFAWLC